MGINIGWLKKAGEKFYARTHADAVEMPDGGMLTAKISSILEKFKEHHHQASDVNDLKHFVNDALSNAAGEIIPPMNHATSETKYGVATSSSYGHVRTAGNVSAAHQYVIPFSKQYSSAQTSLNNTSMCYNGMYAIAFKGNATGAPTGLAEATTYYGTIFTMNYQQTSGVSSTYGVTQILTIPIIGKLYVRFITGTSAYGEWIDLTAIASGWN